MHPGHSFFAALEREFRDDEVEEAALFWPDAEAEVLCARACAGVWRLPGWREVSALIIRKKYCRVSVAMIVL
jgi:hypothetical protein